MRFTENSNGNEFEMDSFVGFIKSVASLVVLAPFRLIHEISLKVVFIKKELIQKVFAVAIATGVIFCVFDVLSSMFIAYSGTFLTDSLVVYAISTVIVCLLSVVYKNANTMVYEQLDRMFSSGSTGEGGTGVDGNSAVAGVGVGVAETEAVQADSTRAEKVAGTMESLTHLAGTMNAAVGDGCAESVVGVTCESGVQNSAITEEPMNTPGAVGHDGMTDRIFISDDVEALVKLYENSVADIQAEMALYNADMTEEEASKFSKELEDCTDPSRYISEELIKAFDKNAEKEDLSFLADLDLSIIPESFNILV